MTVKTMYGLLLITLLFSACSYEILTPATYQEKFKPNEIPFEIESYTFSSGHKFEYRFFHDNLNNSKYGFGHYHIENGELILNFYSQPMDTLESTLKIEKTDRTDPASIHLHVHTQSFRGEGLLGVNVFLQNTAMGTTTDKGGNATLKISENDLPDNLVISRLDYQNLEYEVDADHNLNLIANLAFRNYGSQIKEENRKRKIKIGKNVIVLDGKKYVKIP